MLFKASAPGSLMLLGEYAVLHGKMAVVCAVDKRMTVSITPRSDQRIEIISPRLGRWAGDLSTLTISSPFHFVTASLLQQRKKLSSGCTIEINAEFCDQVGLGSSAAVTVATLAALFAWRGVRYSPQMLIREARLVIRKVQGVGSGADVAASVLGGVLAYRATPFEVEQFSLSLPLTVIYSGAKTPTTVAIQKVQDYFLAFPQLFNKLCDAVGACVKEGIAALRSEDWPRLGKVMNIQQGLMQALAVSTPMLDDLLAQLHAQPTVMGAKISGSGLGDCVIGLGEAQLKDVQQIQVRMAQEGLITVPHFNEGKHGKT